MGGPAHDQSMSAARAVAIGHLWVNAPVLLLIGGAGTLGWMAWGQIGLVLAVFVGMVPAWASWSFNVPRWRRWALRRGAPPDELQKIGERTGLVWPRGSFLERTEMRLPPENGDRRQE